MILARTLPGIISRASGWAPTEIANLKLWVDATDLSTLFQDSAKTTPVASDGDRIGAWVDKSGQGNDLLQASASNRPEYKASGIGGLPAYHCLATGTTFMRAAFTLAQPHSIYVVLSNTKNSGTSHVIGGVSANAGVLYRNGNPNELQLFSGSLGPKLFALGTEDALISAFFSGASSSIQENTGTPATGNPGTGSPGGITVTASNSSDQPATGTYVGEICVFSSALSSGDKDTLQAYLMDKWGLA